MAEILHVDDGEYWRTEVHQVLTEAGFTVTSCATLIDAQMAYAQNPDKFAVVICDNTIDLPGDGYRWATMLAQQRDQKAIVLSGLELKWDGVIFGTAKKSPQALKNLPSWIQRAIDHVPRNEEEDEE